MASRKYGPKAAKKVERAMHEMKEGTLRSGRSGSTVLDSSATVSASPCTARRTEPAVGANVGSFTSASFMEGIE